MNMDLIVQVNAAVVLLKMHVEYVVEPLQMWNNAVQIVTLQVSTSINMA